MAIGATTSGRRTGDGPRPRWRPNPACVCALQQHTRFLSSAEGRPHVTVRLIHQREVGAHALGVGRRRTQSCSHTSVAMPQRFAREKFQRVSMEYCTRQHAVAVGARKLRLYM